MAVPRPRRVRCGSDPWKRLSTALRGWVYPDAFEMLRGTVSHGFEIPYQHLGAPRAYTPDFLVEVLSPDRPGGVEHLVVEVKGLEREQDRSKDVGAARWIAAVNHWGRMGVWRYAKVRTPFGLRQALG